MTNRRILNYFLLTLCLFLFSSIKLTAGSASMSFSGAGSVYNGNNIEVVAAKDLEGDTIALAAQLTGVDESKKDLALISLGEIKEDEPTTDPTAEPTTEPTVAPTTDPNGEKDDTPKTGVIDVTVYAVLTATIAVAGIAVARKMKK